MKLYFISKEIKNAISFIRVFNTSLDFNKLVKLNGVLIFFFLWILKIVLIDENRSLNYFFNDQVFFIFIILFVFFNTIHLVFAIVYYYFKRYKYVHVNSGEVLLSNQYCKVKSFRAEGLKGILELENSKILEFWFFDEVDLRHFNIIVSGLEQDN